MAKRRSVCLRHSLVQELSWLQEGDVINFPVTLTSEHITLKT